MSWIVGEVLCVIDSSVVVVFRCDKSPDIAVTNCRLLLISLKGRKNPNQIAKIAHRLRIVLRAAISTIFSEGLRIMVKNKQVNMMKTHHDAEA
ncbi:hypothetical protein KIN20_024880 [Parelaphostrongylus tenuis]|uniref:Uncharacterized protein n=1 Tax=Parelaphostrongylus tenuis TaxID=148309 RepID=A0AAD5MYU4_PARTN|nr:hypothetical protein KIN20_024880 [Parelaphostrongylus tenuis]